MQEEDYILIEKYITGELDESALKAFNARMQSDAVFEEEVSLRKKMDDFLTIKNTEGVSKDQLAAWNKESFKKIKPNSEEGISRRLWWKIAASLLLLIGAAFIFRQFSSSDTSDLYKKYAVHQSLEVGTKSGVNATDSIKLLAADFFNQKKYTDASTLLEKYFETIEEDPRMKLGLGICYLEMNNLEQAKNIFEEISDGNSIMKQEAKWYLALFYLKTNNTSMTQNILTEIKNSSDFRARDAGNLLEELP